MTLRKKLFTLFFLSGFCGLLYQVIWVRLAFSHFGVITPVLSVIVSVFMLGLSIGSWAAGKWISPLSKRFKISAAYVYALAEFLIGISAFAVPWLFAQGDTLLLPSGEMNSISYLIYSALIMTVAVLPWTLCMGATFPLMMAFIKERDPESKAGFSFLYLANVIGAVSGTILTADVFVELFGFHHTLLIAGLTNFLIAAMALTLPSSGLSAPSPASGEGKSDLPSPASSGRPALPQFLIARQSRVVAGGWRSTGEGTTWMATILFVTGFTSMSAEVVWTRAFTPVLNTTIYAFALVLAIYLAATAIGSYFYRKHLEQGSVISNAALMAGLALGAFLPLTLNDPRLDLRTFGVEIGIFPLCAVLGYLTPKIIDQYSQGDPNQAGRAYAINVVGCVIGPLFASYIMLPEWGVKVSLVLLSLPFVFFFLAYSRRLSAMIRTGTSVAVAALLICGVWVNQSYEEKYPGGVVRRDHTATVISAGTGRDKHLYVNGQGITCLTTITKAMAHLPLAYHTGPSHSTLTICFGMGTTYRSLLTWGIKTTAVELVPSVKKAFVYYHPDAQKVLDNPLGQVVVDDGRRFLRRTSELFDIVTIDPPPPVEAAGSSLLYSPEFYTLMKKKMAPNAILQQWFPGNEGPDAQAIARSLVNSFTYVKVYRSLEHEGLHFLASMDPLHTPTVDEFVARLPPAAKSDLIEWEKTDVKTTAQRILSQEVSLDYILGNNPRRMITDDFPFNEYYLLRRSWARAQRIAATL